MADQPFAVGSNGTITAVFVETVADKDSPTVAEITAGSSLDITCYLTGDGLETDTSENTVDDPRLCSKAIFEAPGDYTDTLQLTYVYNPESPTDDEARLTMPEGTTGYIILRWAVDAEQAFATGDIVDVYPVRMGVQKKTTPARNTVHRIMQKPFVTGAVARDAVVV